MTLSIEAELERIASWVKAKDSDALLKVALASGEDDSSALARRAVLGLATLGKAGGKLLTAALGSEVGPERGRAAMALGDLGDKAAAKALAAGDPYANAGLFASVDIRPWKWVIGNPDA